MTVILILRSIYLTWLRNYKQGLSLINILIKLVSFRTTIWNFYSSINILKCFSKALKDIPFQYFLSCLWCDIYRAPVKDLVDRNWYPSSTAIFWRIDWKQSLWLLVFVCNGHYFWMIMILEFVFNRVLKL